MKMGIRNTLKSKLFFMYPSVFQQRLEIQYDYAQKIIQVLAHTRDQKTNGWVDTDIWDDYNAVSLKSFLSITF